MEGSRIQIFHRLKKKKVHIKTKVKEVRLRENDKKVSILPSVCDGFVCWMLTSKYFASGTQLKRVGIKLSEVRSKIPFCDTCIQAAFGKYHVLVFEPLCLALM